MTHLPDALGVADPNAVRAAGLVLGAGVRRRRAGLRGVVALRHRVDTERQLEIVLREELAHGAVRAWAGYLPVALGVAHVDRRVVGAAAVRARAADSTLLVLRWSAHGGGGESDGGGEDVHLGR